MNKTKIINFLGAAIIVLTAFQGFIPGMPLHNPETIKILSAITMFLVTTLTVWKTAINKLVDNTAIIPVLAMAIIATFGGINDLIGYFHIPENVGQWLRFGITAITAILDLVSKKYFPSVQAQIEKQSKQ